MCTEGSWGDLFRNPEPLSTGMPQNFIVGLLVRIEAVRWMWASWVCTNVDGLRGHGLHRGLKATSNGRKGL